MITLVVTLRLLGAPETVDQNRIDFFEKSLRLYRYLSRSVRDSDTLSPLS